MDSLSNRIESAVMLSTRANFEKADEIFKDRQNSLDRYSLARDAATKYADGVYRFVVTSARKNLRSATKNDMKLKGSS